jgi:tRNA modification GTPase
METIFALASAPGKSGVAVIRLSGLRSFAAVEALCGPLPEVRKAALRCLRWNGEVLDEGLVLIFEKNASFTGEQSAELQIHGSIASVRAVLRALGQIPGLRPAEAGEFTRRALENGRLDLTQVEGLADLIDAETEAQRRQAFRVMSGALGQKAIAWRVKLVRAGALLAASIDFSDEDIPPDLTHEVLVLATEVLAAIQAEMIGSYAAERVKDGFEVAIVGAPNVGKSTLLNALAGRGAAITSDVPGTTRDIIEVRMEIAGQAVTLLDTAGLRDTDDQLERMGVDLAVARATAADIRVFLVSNPSEALAVKTQPGDIIVLGKADLFPQNDEGISGKTGWGVSRLIDRIASEVSVRTAGSGLMIRERHFLAAKRAAESLSRALYLLGSGGAVELVAEELRYASSALEELIGKIDVESLLDEVFSSFCIGK